jgi:hypothetical protein
MMRPLNNLLSEPLFLIFNFRFVNNSFYKPYLDLNLSFNISTSNLNIPFDLGFSFNISTSNFYLSLLGSSQSPSKRCQVIVEQSTNLGHPSDTLATWHRKKSSSQVIHYLKQSDNIHSAVDFLSD